MDITPLLEQGRQIIQGYGGGRFRISGAVYETPVIVYPDAVEAWRFSGDPRVVAAGDFSQVLSSGRQIDVLLFGSGAAMAFLSPALRQELRAAGLPVEAMDTGAACRTYNVLLAEGRRVAAALLPDNGSPA